MNLLQLYTQQLNKNSKCFMIECESAWYRQKVVLKGWRKKKDLCILQHFVTALFWSGVKPSFQQSIWSHDERQIAVSAKGKEKNKRWQERDAITVNWETAARMMQKKMEAEMGAGRRKQLVEHFESHRDGFGQHRRKIRSMTFGFKRSLCLASPVVGWSHKLPMYSEMFSTTWLQTDKILLVKTSNPFGKCLIQQPAHSKDGDSVNISCWYCN